jgi:hypothetical protein
MATGVDEIKAIRPSRVRLFGRVAKLIDYRRNLDAEFSHARSSYQRALLFVLGTRQNNLILYIALHLPYVARVRFRDVHHQKSDFVPILLIKLIKSGNLPPERRSCVAAKDEHHGLALRRQTREPH